MFKNILIVLMSLAFVATACDKQQENASAEEPAQEAEAAATDEGEAAAADKAAEEEPAAEEAEAKELAVVDVPEEGKVFDPPIQAEQVPAGAWYCDMGTVHYASGEKGDGTCPECNMKLKQKTGDAKEAGADEAAADDHAGHNH